MALSNGTRLGPYEIVATVGAGGMGEVYRARDARLGRDVAIKILPASLAQDGDRLRRFEQEARAVAALNHPNILTVFDVGTTPVIAQAGPSGVATAPAGSPYLVTELLEGSSLRERLAAGALTPRKVIDYATQVARGLAAAHERGIVHRDLKPDNIFVTADGRVKILDFGLAKLTEPSAAGEGKTIDTGTQAGVVMGTVGYMSPEQVRGKVADARSDIFSFGAVLYEMVSGRKAFAGESTADVMSAILKDDPPELTPASGAVAPALDHIIRRCLEKEPQQRFQSAGDLAFHIAELSGTGATSTLSAEKAPGQRKFQYVSAAAVAVVAMVAIAWFAGRATLTVPPMQFQRITFQQGNVDSARFLPDGQGVMAAARWGDEKRFSLSTARFDSVGTRSMDMAADQLLGISRTGEMAVLQNATSLGIGYVRTGTLARAPLGGGAPRPVIDSVQYADWSPDGSSLAVVRFAPATHTYRLEYPVGNVLYETTGWISDPRISRDGKSIAFLDHPGFGDDMGFVNVLEIGGKRRVLTPAYSATQGLAWSPNGKEVWFTAAVTGPNTILMAASLSGKVRPLLDAPGSVQLEDVLPDGRVLIIQRERRRILKVSTPDGTKERDFSWLDWAYEVFFSFDGKQVIFGDQDAGDRYGVFMRDMDGATAATQLGEGDPQDISFDGRWVVTRLASKNGDLQILPTGAGDPKVITRSAVQHRLARWMPDGQHIVFIGNEAGHPERTFLLDLNGKETPITPEGVIGRVPSADGTSVLVRMPDKSWRLQRITGGDPVPVSELQIDDIPLKYSGDGKSIFVARRTPEKTELWQVQVPGGKRTLLHTLKLPDMPGFGGLGFATVTSDGKAYAYQYVQTATTLYVVKGVR